MYSIEPDVPDQGIRSLIGFTVRHTESKLTARGFAPLRVTASSNVGTYLLQSMLVSFQATDPCSIDLWIGPNPNVADRLANGTADVALMEWWSDRPGFCEYTW
jgi:DNA-binding transcriptional LysR family regulator